MNWHPAILGTVRPDPAGQVLGTGFWQFSSPYGVDGLARWTADRLDILAVQATAPRTGQFRAFIGATQTNFKTVALWEVYSPILLKCLPRYGFKFATLRVPETGEICLGFRWDFQSPPPPLDQ